MPGENGKPIVENGRVVRDHKYHAEAHSVEGLLVLPRAAKIEPQAHSHIRTLVVPKKEVKGHYESQQAEPYRLEGIVSYTAANTQAAGNEESEAKGKAFKTLATAVVENLNILNVVTCDRIVAQVCTKHPRYEDEGHVPTVTFLGTQFYNLRIAGFPVQVELDLDLLNPKEDVHKRPYTREESFLDWVAARFNIFKEKKKGCGDFKEKNELSQDVSDYYESPAGKDDTTCTYYSLVTGVTGKFPGTSYGNVLDIPHFGKVHLGIVSVKHSHYGDDGIPKTTYIELKMVDARMGCIGSGNVSCCITKNNGGSIPPTG